MRTRTANPGDLETVRTQALINGEFAAPDPELPDTTWIALR